MSRGNKEERNVSEDAVGVVLTELVKEKKIKHFFKNKKNDRMDNEGWDFFIVLNNSLYVPFQVKTESGKETYEQQYAEHIRKHPWVKFLISVPAHFLQKKPEAVYAKIRESLGGIIFEATSASK